MENVLNESELEQLECVYVRPDTLTDTRFHYCPGCGHSVVHRAIMEVLEELDSLGAEVDRG